MKTPEEIARWCDTMLNRHPNIEDTNFFNSIKDYMKEPRPQGKWIEYNATGKKQYMCSECCMKEKNPKIARYCYWCGAKMKGGAE